MTQEKTGGKPYQIILFRKVNGKNYKEVGAALVLGIADRGQ